MDKKYENYIKNPELLKGRFENGFPMLYPMDSVKVNSKESKNSKNPLESRLGHVYKISHGIQSRFNRDYILVGLIGGEKLGAEPNFETWLYTLDLIKKDDFTGIASSVQNQFGCLLYLDDRVKIVKHASAEGTIGFINSLEQRGFQESDLLLKVRSEAKIKEVQKLREEMDEKVEQDFQKIDTTQEFDKFIMELRRGHIGLYQFLEYEGRTREMYKMTLKEEIYRELATDQDFQRKLKFLEEQIPIDVFSRDVELVERFPPNDLFKL